MADREIHDAVASTSAPRFRSKKRKLYRQRVASPDDGGDRSGTPILDNSLSPASVGSTPAMRIEERSNDYEENEPNMTKILRMRKLRKHRAVGVEFRSSQSTPAISTSQELVPAFNQTQEQEEGGLSVAKQFVSQTGTSATLVDKHMMEYIDFKLAERSNPTATMTSDSIFNKPRSEDVSPSKAIAPHETLSQGKIQEIELSEDPAERLQTRVINKTSINAVQQQPKPRIGRNGKPYVPNSRNRRTSEELRRDALVDAFLTENTLGYYEQPKASLRGGGAEAGNDEDADEEMAERFRREFEDAANERNRVRPAAAPVQKSGYGQKEEEILKGPKLGGSRMQRQAMREVLLKAEKDKGKK